MAQVGDKTHTPHGLGTITEIDSVRGRTQYRVAGAGFNVWLDETKVHVAKQDGLFSYGPIMQYAEEARNTPQYSIGYDPSEEDPSIEHFAGLDATIEPGSTPVNERNHTDLPYDWNPQYHHDVWADEQTIQPGEQEIDAEDRLRATDSVSGERAKERPYPGPSPDLFAKSSSRHQAGPFGVQFYPGSMDDYFDYVDDENARERELQRKRDEDDKAEGKWPRDSKGRPPGHQNYKMEERHAGRDDDIYHVEHGKGWSGGYIDPEYAIDPWKTDPDVAVDSMADHNAEATHHLDHDPYDAPYTPEGEPHHGSYRPAGLSDRYAYFELEAADNDSPIAQFRRDPVAYIQMCGHLWTDGDDSLEKFADYTGLIDVDPTMREAAWSDVRQKAQRLRREGRVHVNDMGEGRIYATVEGDHGTYDTMIAKGGSMGGFGGGQSITNWACSCDWGRWAFKRQMTYVGRLCSHGYATYLTMQSDYTKANPITKNQPYKKKWARTAGVVEDYKSWLEDNDQNPEAASVAAFLSTIGDENPDDAEALYDYISDNHAEAPERDHDIEYVNTPDEAYKTSAYSTHSQPHKARPKGEGYEQQLPDGAFDIADAVSELDEPVDDAYWEGSQVHDVHGHDSLYEASRHQADLLRTTPRSLTPDLRAVPEGEGEQWVDVTKDERETTGPDNNVHEAMLRFLHGGEGITDFNMPNQPAAPTPAGGSGGGTINDPLNPSASSGDSTAPSSGGGSGGGTINDPLHPTASRRYAESSDASLLDKLRDLSTTPAADDLGHMDDHNEELRDVVDELQDRGYDASFMVAAVDDDPSDGKGDFAGKSVADWANEPFAGSGPAPKNWFSDSAGYVDENERDRFIDVTDAPDGDIIKFNDDRSKPQQGPKKSGSRRRADNFSPDSTVTGSSPGMGSMAPDPSSMGAGAPDTTTEPFDASQTLASLHHIAEMPSANDWDNASGEPFMDEVKKDLGGDEDAEEGDGGGDSGGGGGGLSSALPGLVKGLGGGGGAAAGAAGAAGGGAAASELAGLAVLANGGGGGVRRAGRGASAQVRVDPGARQPNRPRQAMNPPDDFGYSGGEIHMAAPEDNGDDIVAAFQRSAGAEAVMGSGGGDSGDIADRALAFLRTAGRKYSPAEQRELEAEHHPLGARNLPTEEELSGTHYVLGM